MADVNLDDKSVDEMPEVENEPTDSQEDLEPEEKALTESEEELSSTEESDQPIEPQEPTESEPQQMSRRKAKRLEKLEGLVERLRGPQQQQRTSGRNIDFRKMIDADEEVYQQLDKASQDFGQTQYDAGLQAANSVRFHTRLEIDAPRVEGNYSQLDSKSSDFNPHLTDAVNKFYLGMVGYDPQTDTVQNPNLRYSDFVDALAELGEAMFSTKTAQTTQNIARQAAKAGIRPDGSSAKPMNLGKAPQDMTEEELKAAISASLPRDNRGRFSPR